MKRQELSSEFLRSILDYDPNEGSFTWRARPKEMFSSERTWKSWNAKFAGKLASNTPNGRGGYCIFRINDVAYSAHRVAIAITTGRWPRVVDHIDGCGSNNRLANLRDASFAENGLNRRLPSNNKSGRIGVRWSEKCRRWVATIRFQRQFIFLGHFERFEEACTARCAAEEKYGFHHNHGSRRAHLTHQESKT